MADPRSARHHALGQLIRARREALGISQEDLAHAYAIPTLLIARLAVDKHRQGQQLRSRLLAEALRFAVAASDATAARLVVVDAIDGRAAGFYRNRGFIDVPENPLRLYREVSDARAARCEPAIRGRDLESPRNPPAGCS